MIIYRRNIDELEIDDDIESTIRGDSIVDPMLIVEEISFAPRRETVSDGLYLRDNFIYSFGLRHETIEEDAVVFVEQIRSRLNSQAVSDSLTAIDSIIEGIAAITPMADEIEIAETIAIMYAVRNYILEDSLILRESKSGGETF